MITKPIDQVTAEDIEGLVKNGIEEGKSLDFKSELPKGNDQEKVEFCGDVSAMANSGGGYLLYGIEDADGVAQRVVGLPGVEIDAAILRLEQVLESGIEPSVPGVVSRSVELASGDKIILLQIPRSWRSPHLVKTGRSYRMYARNSRGKQPLDAHQIRLAFEESSSLPDKIKRWREDRIARVLANETPVAIDNKPKLVFHLVPLDSFIDPYRFSVSELHGKIIPFEPLATGVWDHRINVDGYVAYGGNGENGSNTSYCQVFRSGKIEAVYTEFGSEVGDIYGIGSGVYEKDIIEATTRYLKELVTLGCLFPVAVSISLLDVKGVVMWTSPELHRTATKAIDRELFLLPDVLLDCMPADMPRALKPLFDAVWNACGGRESFNYDENGYWNGGALKKEVPVTLPT